MVDCTETVATKGHPKTIKPSPSLSEPLIMDIAWQASNYALWLTHTEDGSTTS